MHAPPRPRWCENPFSHFPPRFGLHAPLRSRLGLVSLVLLATGLQCGPAPRVGVEQLLEEFTGEAERRLRTTDELEAAYARVLESLSSGMGAEQIVDREGPQKTFEMICLRSARPGAEYERVALCKAITAQLVGGAQLVGSAHPTLDGRKPRGTAATVWMIRQLERIGKAESVGRLAELLEDDDQHIRELARRALEVNPADEAAEALRSALNRSGEGDPAWQVALINALAARGDQPSLALAAPLTGAKHREVSAAAIAAFGDLGGARAVDLLQVFWRGTDDYPSRRLQPARTSAQAEACGSGLRIAERLVQAGEHEQAAGIYQDLYASGNARSTRLAALRGLTIAQPEQVLPQLLAIIRGEVNPELLRHAAGFTREMTGENVTRALAAELSSAPADAQVVLLNVLADRGDLLAKPAVVEAAKSPDEAVRIATLAAMRELGDHTDAILLAEAAADSDGQERATARESLSRLRGENVDETILAGAQEQVEPNVRAELIRALGQRGFSPAASTLLETAGDPSETVRIASFKALGDLSGEEDLPELIRLAVGESSDEARESAEDAIVEVCLRIDDEERRAEPVLAVAMGIDRLESRSHGGPGRSHSGPSRSHNGVGKASLVRVLGRVRGESALKAIRVALHGDEAKVVDAAVRALAKWDNVDVLGDLRDIVAVSSLKEHKVLALRGYVRIVRLPSERQPRETLDLLEEAMRLAERPTERKLVLGALSDVIELDSLRMAQSYLADEELREEAATAAINIARPLSARYRDEAVAAVERLLALDLSDALHSRAEAAIDYIEAHFGDIATWLISGPYTQAGVKATDLLDTPFPPEKERANRDATVRERAQLAPDALWRNLKITDPRDPWSFDLEEAVGGSNRCVYVTTQILSDTAQKAVLEIGSDDGVKAWLNGEVVHSNNASRGLTAGEDKVEVTLNAGANTLLLKITQGGGGWGFTCSVTSPEGETLEGLRFEGESRGLLPGRNSPGPHNVLTDRERKAGWRLLFDGKTTKGWRGFKKDYMPDGWQAIDGCLVRVGSAGDIITEEQFDNFELALEWRVCPGGNSGVFYNVSEEGKYVWSTGPEMQVLDNSQHVDGRDAKTSAGANYALHAPIRDVTEPVGLFNKVRILVDGDLVVHWLNGVKIVEYELGSEEWERLVANSKFSSMPMYGRMKKGHIALQDHGDKVWYRNIKIRELPGRGDGDSAP